MKKCYLFLAFIDLMTGMKTKAPEMRMVTIRGPSTRGAEVSTMKQSAAQNRVSRTHWVLVRGLRIKWILKKKHRSCSFSDAASICVPVWFAYLFSFTFLATIASMQAMAVMLTMSRTELSISVKWIGLFRPIWIGPITSVSLMFWISW